MKWVFAILVALNLVVFTTTIIRQMVVAPVQNQLQQQQQPAQAPQDRTIVIQTPPPQLTMPNQPVAGTNPAAAKPKAPKADNSNKKADLIVDKPVEKPAAPKNCGGAMVTLKKTIITALKACCPNGQTPPVNPLPPKRITTNAKAHFGWH